MNRRLSIVTLGVGDLAAARAFYVTGLGWPPVLDVTGEVVFIQVAPGVLLALWDRAHMEQDMGLEAGGGTAVVLAHNVDSDDEVGVFVDRARAAGATVLVEPRQAFFGGVHAYLEDPCGFRWEVAHNPGLSVDADGTVRFG